MATVETTSITREVIDNAMSYGAYRRMIDELLDDGKTTGDKDSEALVDYTKMNVHRMRRIDKTITLNDELKARLKAVKGSWIWLVLTEGWCGDAAQNVPALHAMAEAAPNIDFKLILRDEHPDIMDEHLTNGVSRSIPVLICLDAETLDEIGSWGPRPEPVQEMVMKNKETGEKEFKELAEDLHRWYAKDKTRTIQQEFMQKLREWTQH